MDIRKLSYFLTVAKTQNYSHAAKILFISQPALKQAISSLEASLNTKLFIYHQHKLHLTANGELLKERGEPILRDFNQLMLDMKHNAKQKKSITIGLTFLTMLQYIDKVSRFIRQNPTISVKIIQDGSLKLQQLLAQNKIDIAILSFPQIEHDIIIDTANMNNYDYSPCVVLPNEHPLANNHQITFDDLKNYNIASLSDNFALGKFTQNSCRELGISDQIVLIHDDFEILLQILNKLNAVTILPNQLEKFSSTPNLSWIPFNSSYTHYKQGIAYRKKITDIPSVISQFIETIRN